MKLHATHHQSCRRKPQPSDNIHGQNRHHANPSCQRRRQEHHPHSTHEAKLPHHHIADNCQAINRRPFVINHPSLSFHLRIPAI